MSIETREIFIKHIERLAEIHDKSMESIKEFIDKYGLVLGIKKNWKIDGGDAFSDFFMFCLTKSFKSFGAVNTLIQYQFSQDALILLRTIYESYLILSYLIKNPSEIEEILKKRLGFSKGVFQQVKNSKGKVVRGKLIDTRNQEIFDYGISVSKISQNGKYEIDGQIHEVLYKFLSEFVHPNMICSVGYMDEENGKFSYINNSSYFIPMWISVYLQSIILHEIHDFFVIDKRMKRKLEKNCSINLSVLLNVFNFLSAQSEDNKIKFELFIKRLKIIEH